MDNQILFNEIISQLNDSAVEQTVAAYVIHELKDFSFPLENIICLRVEDNTLNGTETQKENWRIHFVNLKTEDDFYIEVSKKSGKFTSRCFTFDEYDNIKLINH